MEAWQTLEHTIIRCFVALTLLSVWTWRFNRPTRFRGQRSKNMAEEFKAYGLSRRTMYTVGFLKIIISLCFLFGHWVPFLIRPAAIILAILMLSSMRTLSLSLCLSVCYDVCLSVTDGSWF